MEPNMSLRFREAVVADADALTALERAANLRALSHIFPPAQYPYPTDEVHSRWLDLLQDASVSVGLWEDAEGLAAFVALDADLLRHLAVRPGLWGTGLAKAAMDWALRREPVQRLWCLEENARAIGFYEHLGWARSGRRQQAEFPPYPAEIELVPGL
jgi:putative acetyltransferase